MWWTITSSDFPQQHPAQMWGRRHQGSLYLKWLTSVVWKSQTQIKVRKSWSCLHNPAAHFTLSLHWKFKCIFQMSVYKYIQNTLHCNSSSLVLAAKLWGCISDKTIWQIHFGIYKHTNLISTVNKSSTPQSEGLLLHTEWGGVFYVTVHYGPSVQYSFSEKMWVQKH